MRRQLSEGASVKLAYAFGLLAVSSTGRMAPIAADIAHAFSASQTDVGRAIGMLFVLSALGATAGGWAADHFRPRHMLITAGLTIAASDLACFLSPHLLWIEIARLLEGIGFVLIGAGAPALIIRMTHGTTQLRAMALWSTYFAAGMACGAILAAPFAGGAHWRTVFILHGAAAILLSMMVRWLPDKQNDSNLHTANHFAVLYRTITQQPRVLLLAGAFACFTMASFGVNVLLPTYLFERYSFPPALGARLIIETNITTIIGALMVGSLLARGWTHYRLLGIAGAAAIMAAFLLFMDQLIFAITGISAILWGVATGFAVSLIMTRLPQIVTRHETIGLANGVVMQAGSLAAVVTPMLYFWLLDDLGPFSIFMANTLLVGAYCALMLGTLRSANV